ncbi:hypothetical protein ABZ468_53510 [Streptomyces sp. NPDC005708]|uniref:hypothetical protein n=1 Tax=Streptomyces sp. NPDC005708 TaxID=3154564 RepID=UPI0033CEC3E5
MSRTRTCVAPDVPTDLGLRPPAPAPPASPRRAGLRNTVQDPDPRLESAAGTLLVQGAVSSFAES